MPTETSQKSEDSAEKIDWKGIIKNLSKMFSDPTSSVSPVESLGRFSTVGDILKSQSSTPPNDVGAPDENKGFFAKRLDELKRAIDEDGEFVRSGGRYGIFGMPIQKEDQIKSQTPLLNLTGGVDKLAKYAGVEKPEGIFGKLALGATQGGADVVGGFTSPEMIQILASTAAFPPAALSFFPSLMGGVYDGIKETYGAVKDGDWQRAARSGVGSIANAYFLKALGSHTLGNKGEVSSPKLEGEASNIGTENIGTADLLKEYAKAKVENIDTRLGGERETVLGSGLGGRGKLTKSELKKISERNKEIDPVKQELIKRAAEQAKQIVVAQQPNETRIDASEVKLPIQEKPASLNATESSITQEFNPEAAPIAAPEATPPIKTPPPSGVIATGDMVPKSRINMNRFSNLELPEQFEAKQGFEKAAPVTEFQRRGVRSLDTTKQAAKVLNTDDGFWSKVETLKPGETLNAEETLSLDNHVAGLAQERVKAWTAYSQNPSAENLGHLNDITSRQIKYSIVSEAAKAETGRALGALRIKVDPKDSILRVAAKIAKDLTPEEQAQLQIKLAGVAPEDIHGQAKVLREFTKSSWVDKIVEFVNAGLLWNPKTHLVNLASNILTTAIQPIEKAFISGADLLRSAVTGNKRERFLAESTSFARGAAEGTPTGIRNFGKALADEAFSSENKGAEAAQNGPAIKGTFGKIVRTPFRLLSAGDELSRSINNRAELRAEAVRQTIVEGLKGKAQKERINELMENPTEEMLKSSKEKAAENIFQTDLPMKDSSKYGSGFWRNVNNLRNQDPTGILRVLIPFFKTPVNLAVYAIRRSPLGLASPNQWRNILKGGGKASESMGQIAMGTTLTAALVALAYQGKITGGGPTDKNERAALMETGWQPYSIKVGDKYVSYQRSDPWSKQFQWAANIADAARNYGRVPSDKIAGEFAIDMTRSVLDQSYMTGLRDVLDAISDPERKGEKFIQSIATRPVPGVMRYFTSLSDNVVRKPEGIGQAFEAMIPGLSKNVPALRDRYGEQVLRKGGLAARALNPYTVSEASKDPVVQELHRLKMDFGVPSNKVVEQDMSQETYDKYQKVSGRLLKASLDTMINSPGYKGLSDLDKIDQIDKIKTKIRSEVMNGVVKPLFIGEELMKLKGKSQDEIMKRVNELNVIFSGTSEEKKQLKDEGEYERE